MKKVFVLGLLIIFSLKGFSQNSKLSLDLNMPIPFGDDAIGAHYLGAIDLGLKYDLIKISKFKLGISTNIGLLNNNAAAVKVLMIKPRFNAQLGLGKITPYVGIGYSFLNYYDDNYPVNSPALDKTSDGLNLNLGFKYHVIPKVYLNFSYDFIKLRAEDSRKINILDIGIGFEL